MTSQWLDRVLADACELECIADSLDDRILAAGGLPLLLAIATLSVRRVALDDVWSVLPFRPA